MRVNSLSIPYLLCLLPILFARCGSPSLVIPSYNEIVIENIHGGSIYLSRPANKIKIGNVISPARRANPFLFQASYWAPDLSVAATAVNAIHIRLKAVAQSENLQTRTSVGFSIVPVSGMDRPSVLLTDIPAGSSIFLKNAPYVGSKVQIQKPSHEPELPGVIAVGDIVIIRYSKRMSFAKIVFENRKGGSVTLIESNGSKRLIARVTKPIEGVGRFEGTQYCGTSAVRANHTGVICISTSRIGKAGGFQIVPIDVAQIPQISYVKHKPQWMIVQSVDKAEPLAGRPPLFRDYLIPGLRVIGVFNEGNSGPLPQLEGKIDDAFKVELPLAHPPADRKEHEQRIKLTAILILNE